MIEDSSVKDKIKAALEKVQPLIISHGGSITIEKVADNIVFVKLHGACTNCPASLYTVQFGLKKAFQDVVPEIVDVVIEE